MLIENLLPIPGAILVIGAHKSGKTALAVQIALHVASGYALFEGQFAVLDPGPVLIIERDDPAGAVTIREYLLKSSLADVVADLPISINTSIDLSLGPQFLEWLEWKVKGQGLKLVVLDSYTALRPHRMRGTDIVKVEQEELEALDALAKRNHCTVLVIHHPSHGNSSQEWSDTAAGTYAMGAATEGQIKIERFRDLPANAPERLLRFRFRHSAGYEMVVRFRPETLDYETLLCGPAAPLYAELALIKAAVGGSLIFEPKHLYQDLGSRASAHRTLNKLLFAGAICKTGHGQYRFAPHVVEALRR
jgi:hypothetical protein